MEEIQMQLDNRKSPNKSPVRKTINKTKTNQTTIEVPPEAQRLNLSTETGSECMSPMQAF